MDATRIIAIRHGETAWNVDTRIQGHLDIPLNDTGLWQARQVARALASEPEEAEIPKIQAKIEKGLPPIESDAAKVNGEPAAEPKKDDKKT